MNWKTLTKTAKRTLSRNGSKILLGFGIAGAFTAVGFAITATPKAMILLDEKKKELGVEKLDAKTIVKTAAPVYIPTAISIRSTVLVWTKRECLVWYWTTTRLRNGWGIDIFRPRREKFSLSYGGNTPTL